MRKENTLNTGSDLSSTPKNPTVLSTQEISKRLKNLGKQVISSNNFQQALGSLSSALVVVSASHPLDTVRRRIQVSSTPLNNAKDYLNVALGPHYQQANQPWVRELYAGMQPALLQRGWQLPYRWITTNACKDYLFTPHLGPVIEKAYGKKTAHILCSGLAGATAGILEVALLKWDSEKIARQTQTGPVKLSWQQAYKAAGITAARNSLGSFLIFSTNTSIKEFMFNGKKYEELGFIKGSLGFVIGGLIGAVATYPLDTIKVKVQNESGKRNARVIAKEMYQSHGLKRFYRSQGLGCLFVGVRVGMEFSITEYFSPFFKRLCQRLGDPSVLTPDPNNTCRKFANQKQ